MSKKQTTKTPKSLIFVFLLIGCMPFLMLLPEYTSQLQKLLPLRGDDALRALQGNYYKEKNLHPEAWWMESVPREQNQQLALITNRLQSIRAITNTYRDVSPFAQEVAEHYKAFIVSLAISPNASISLLTEGEQKHIGKTPVISFVAKNIVKSMGTEFSVYWRSDWGLIVNAVEHPPIVFAGLMFHELGHGRIHPVAPETKFFAFESREYALEEMQMHELETLVMNRASAGSFLKNVHAVVDRKKSAKSFESVLRALTMNDLQRLDESLGASNAGLETSQLLFAHYLMAIGLEYIREKGMGDDEKIRLFRWAQTILVK